MRSVCSIHSFLNSPELIAAARCVCAACLALGTRGCSLPRVRCVCLGPPRRSDTQMQMAQGAGPGVPLDTLWQSAGSCSLADYKTGNPFNYLRSRRRGGCGGLESRDCVPRALCQRDGGGRGGGIQSWVYCKEGEGVYFSVLSSLSLPLRPCVELLVSNSFPAMLRSSSRAALRGPAVI